MFVPEDSVIRIFREMREGSIPGSYVIFTTIPHPYPGSVISRWLQKYVMKKENCPFAWTIPIEKLKAFVISQHYRLVQHISYETLQEHHAERKKQLTTRLIEDIHIAATANM